MNYSELLSYLFSVTRVKLKDASAILHYDISYISKWVNGHNLPAINQINHINNELAKNFTSIIISKGLQEKIESIAKPNLDMTVNSVLHTFLFNTLNTAYYLQFNEQNNSKIIPQEESHVVCGPDNIKDFLYPIFSIPVSDKDIIAYSTLNRDYLAEIINYTKDILLFSLEKPVTINLIIDQPNILEIQYEPLEIIRLVSELIYYDVNIYTKVQNKRDRQFIYIKDEFVIFFEMDNNNKPYVATFTRNADTIKEIENIITSTFVTENRVVATEDDFAYEEIFYRNNFTPMNDLTMHLSQLNALFISDTLLNKILKRLKYSEAEKRTLTKIVRLQRHMMENFGSTIVININSLYKCLYTKKINIATESIYLMDKEFDEYIENLKEIINNSNNIKFVVLNSNSFISSNWNFPLSFLVTNRSFAIKKPKSYSDSEDFKYILVFDEDIKSILINSFMELKNLNCLEPMDKNQFLNSFEAIMKEIEISKLH